ncbi:MAG TPA: hypothetical protein DD670_11265 [Planctomycetaceae bacterium]|nr:hypothetical protein [Planctomycetaceae bacterium]
MSVVLSRARRVCAPAVFVRLIGPNRAGARASVAAVWSSLWQVSACAGSRRAEWCPYAPNRLTRIGEVLLEQASRGAFGRVGVLAQRFAPRRLQLCPKAVACVVVRPSSVRTAGRVFSSLPSIHRETR